MRNWYPLTETGDDFLYTAGWAESLARRVADSMTGKAT